MRSFVKDKFVLRTFIVLERASQSASKWRNISKVTKIFLKGVEESLLKMKKKFKSIRSHFM